MQSRLVPGGLSSGPGFSNGQAFLVVVWVLDFLCPVGEVPEDADAVLHALVVDVGLLDGLLDRVENAVAKALALAQLLTTVVTSRAHVPQDSRRVSEHCNTQTG